MVWKSSILRRLDVTTTTYATNARYPFYICNMIWIALACFSKWKLIDSGCSTKILILEIFVINIHVCSLKSIITLIKMLYCIYMYTVGNWNICFCLFFLYQLRHRILSVLKRILSSKTHWLGQHWVMYTHNKCTAPI